jgi:hypothetical protein
MSEQNFFRNKEEELQRLTQEIADLKSTMKDMASSLTRIERHVKRSFGIAPKSKSSVKRGTFVQNVLDGLSEV